MIFEGKCIMGKEKSDMEEFASPGLVAILPTRNGITLELEAFTQDLYIPNDTLLYPLGNSKWA